MKKITEIYEKYKEIILYLLFGVITTVVSLGVCYLTLKIGVRYIHDENGDPTELLDVLGSTTQWVSGVIVAFFTNRIFVFKGAEKGFLAGCKQFAVFSGSRVGTYFLEVVINLAMIAFFGLVGYKTVTLTIFGLSFPFTDRFWAKAVGAVLVVITNYFISKLLVFRKKKQ
ncbi:MAG: GtrA family protein [Ruminococcaceae bacterium]|nr:GtrA family protein [Oscillospiraceae bacterium]